MDEQKAVETLNKIQDRAMLTQLEVDLSNLCIKRRNIIKKAIEHIETHQLCYQSQYKEMSGFDNHLLDILRGEDNE